MEPGIEQEAAQQAIQSRRGFLRWLGSLTIVSTAVMVLTPVVAFLVPNNGGRAAGGGKVAVGTTADIPPGAGKVVSMGAKPAIIVNTAGARVSAATSATRTPIAAGMPRLWK